MSRRVLSTVSAQAGRILATAARPTIASTSRFVVPVAATQISARRSYHEKGTFISKTRLVLASHSARLSTFNQSETDTYTNFQSSTTTTTPAMSAR
jgi:hypothetical protein